MRAGTGAGAGAGTTLAEIRSGADAETLMRAGTGAGAGAGTTLAEIGSRGGVRDGGHGDGAVADADAAAESDAADCEKWFPLSDGAWAR